MATKDTAQQILDEVGGPDNIVDFTHCATRLRFTLKDATGIDKAKVDAIDGVMASIPQGDTNFQVVIGGGVAEVFNAINALPGMDGESEGPTVMKRKPKGGEAKAADDGADDKADKASADNAGVKGDNRSAADIKAESRKKRKSNKYVDAFFDYLSDSFRPILGVLLAASLVLAGLNLCISLGWIETDTQNPTVMFFKAMGQGVFYFLPIMIAYNASKKLKVDPWVGALIMMIVMTPHFLALGNPLENISYFGNEGEAQGAAACLSQVTNDLLGDKGTLTFTEVFGLPMLVYNYSGNVFVPLIMAPVLALVYKGFQKIIPSSLHLVFVPFFSVVIVSILTAFILGPIGVYAGSYLGIALSWMNSHVPYIFMVVIPLLYPFLVPLGLHWPLNALMLMNINSMGYDFIQGPMGVWNFACFGATFGVLLIAIRERDTAMRSVSGGALAAGLLGGVSEPSLYGIHLRYKRAYPSLIIGCAIGGITIAVLSFFFPSSVSGSGVTTGIFAFTSLLTIPAFDPILVYVISIGVAFAASCVAVVIRDYRTPEERTAQRALNAAIRNGVAGVEDLMNVEFDREAFKRVGDIMTIDVNSAVEGKTITLKQTKDPAFSMNALGHGLAVTPNEGVDEVFAPVGGVVQDVAKTKHAITIAGDDGEIILVHVGIDTVNLDGQHFDPKVEKGDEVEAGDLIMKADFAKIAAAGYRTHVVITVVNSLQTNAVEPQSPGQEVSVGDSVIRVEL